MKKITAGQFFVMLYLSKIFSFFTIIPGVSRPVGGASGLLSLPLSALLAIVILLPAYFLLRGHPGVGLVEYAYDKSPMAGAACATFFCLLTIWECVDNVVHFEMFITTAVYPDDKSFFFVVLFVLVAMYLVWMGLESTARLSGVVMVLLIASLLLIVVSLTQEFNTVGLFSPFMGGLKKIGQGALDTVNETSELALIFLYIPFIRGKMKKSFFIWVFGVLFTLEALILLILCTVGDYSVTQTFPLYGVAKMAQLFYFQRMDAVHMVVWTMVGLIKTAVHLFICRQCLCYLLPRKAQKFALLFLGAVIGGLALITTHYNGLFRAQYTAYMTGIPLYLSLLVIPLVLRLIPKKKKKGGEGA